MSTPQHRLPGLGPDAVGRGTTTAQAREPWTVGTLTAALKEMLEDSFPAVCVRGEVSNFRQQASGHCYFSLKDATAQLSAVLFRGAAARLREPVRDGQQIVAWGEISVYEARGAYQLIVRELLPDGEGRLRREFDALRARLTAEGLFDTARKRPLPPVPSTVGFVTSPTGAAAQDFCRILSRRGWRGRVGIIPTRVQGAGAGAEIAAALLWASTLRTADDRSPRPPSGPGDPRPPFFGLLVVGRGGGSLEDLWCFNEEVLVRAIASCPVPVVSAVGHETDLTLADFAADVRAETPSGAAELISSGFVAAKERVARAGEHLPARARRRLRTERDRLALLGSRLRLVSPASILRQHLLRLDELQARLDGATTSARQVARHRLARVASRLAAASPAIRLRLARTRLDQLSRRLAASSLQSALHRGFALLRDADGRVLTRAAAIPANVTISATFADGQVTLRSASAPQASHA